MSNTDESPDPGFISNYAIQALNRQASHDNPAFTRLMGEIADDHTVPYRYAVGNRVKTGEFQFSTFNDNADSEDMTLVLLGWGSDYRKMGSARGLATFALNDPNQRFAVCNFMGRGDSTPLPLSRSLAIAKTGSYIPAGELLQGALRQTGVLNDAKAVHIIGESEGHRLAMGAVASGLEVENGIFIDGPGALKLGVLGLARAFKNTERIHGQQYIALSDDLWSREEEEESPTSPYKEAMSLIKQGIGRAVSHYILHPTGLSKAGLEADTAKAMANIRQDLTVISLAESALTNHTQVDAMLRGAAGGGKVPRVTHRVVSGLTHSYGLAGPGTRAHLVSAKTDKTEKVK